MPIEKSDNTRVELPIKLLLPPKEVIELLTRLRLLKEILPDLLYDTLESVPEFKLAVEERRKTMDEVKDLLLKLVKLGFLSNLKRPDGTYKEVDGIYGKRTKLAHLNYLNSTTTKPKTSAMSFLQIKDYEDLVNQLSNKEIINYYHQTHPSNTPYIIDDKVNGNLSIYINGLRVREYKAIHGKNSTSFGNTYKRKQKGKAEYIVKPGDILGVIAKESGVPLDEIVKLNNISNPNLILPGTKLKLPGFSYEDTEVDPDEATVTYVDSNGKLINLGGNLTTPAGVYFTSKAEKLYNGAPSFIRRTKELVLSRSYAGIPSSIHSRTIKENANTNGCTGLSANDLKDMAYILDGYENIPTYILPANNKNKFKIRNGDLSFSSHDINKTPSYFKINTNPIKNIDLTFDDLDNHLIEVLKDYSNGLIEYKKEVQEDLGINNDTYNELARIAIGILGVESNYGKKNSAVGNLTRAFLKFFNNNNSSPDIYSKYDTYGATEDTNSIGLTQIRYSYLDDKLKQLYSKYDISKESLVNNPLKAALATILKLAYEYKNAGMNINKAIKSWNTRDNYVSRVVKAAERATIYQDYIYLKLGGIFPIIIKF